MRVEIDEFLAEALTSSYKEIGKVCNAIDKYLVNVGSYPSCCEESITELYDNMVQQMIRKRKLLQLKNIIQKNIEMLKLNERQIFGAMITLKKCKREDICFLLKIKERTLYRRIESLYKNFAKLLNNSKDKDFILDVCNNEAFIIIKYFSVKERRKSYRNTKESEVCHG